MKKVTIGIPFFNNEQTLSHAIRSTIRQTYSNLEILLIDDGSTDTSLQIAKDFSDSDQRIKIISDGKNKGLIYRLNQIIEIASGEFIARMDADDLMDLERIEKQLKFLLNHPEVDVVTTGMVTMDNNFSPIGKRCCNLIVPNINEIFKNGNGLIHASMMTRIEWSRKNKYLYGFDRAEDRELFTRTITRSIYRIIPEPLYFYMEVGNMSLKKYLQSYSSERKAILKNGPSSIGNVASFKLILRSFLKSFIITAIFTLKQDKKFLSQKGQKLDSQEFDKFEKLIKEIRN